MTIDQPIEMLLRQIYDMDRDACIAELRAYKAIPLDFSPEYLESKSIEWLRHVLAAAIITTRKRFQAA
jgi:hypothetical protein